MIIDYIIDAMKVPNKKKTIAKKIQKAKYHTALGKRKV